MQRQTHRHAQHRAHQHFLGRVPEQFLELVVAEAVVGGEQLADDFVQGLGLHAGGPAQALKQAAVAQAAGIGLYGGTLLEGTIGTVAALHAWSTLETLHWGTEMFGPLLMKDDIVEKPLSFHDNGVDLPQGPGLGVTLNEDKLAEYSRKDQ